MREWMIYTLGPWIQVIVGYGFTLLLIAMLAAIAFAGERWLIGHGKLIWRLPVPVLIYGVFFGMMRFSGLLLYASDGWNARGGFDYTYQVDGFYWLWLSGSLLIGALLAIRKKRI